MDSFTEIIAERRTYTAKQCAHTHSYAQLILPLQGELTIKTEAQNLQVDPETLFFVPPHCYHSFHSTGPNEFIVLDIPHYMIPWSEIQHGGTSYALNHQWRGIRYLIQHEIDRKAAQGSAMKELFPYISHYLLQEQQPTSIRYIHEHYHEDISVSQLAVLEHYNRTYYADWFFKETGKSPSVYIQEVRINKAKELLRDTNLPILQIAIHVGLEHQSSLTRLFQKHEGITPSQYRKTRKIEKS
ncbi:AraC family transcriptional regulator [Paenibacillus selenitireducens]|uniref:AraC family transcriptional regulator n=1 Tax=Paenibacillus selenitireducens TaxID=1324314 RepID=A0A1T2X5G4_9BACL|nr:AraC family transcriptional regulator [Paenibacillus selenitireducens]OPA75141.1 AraC family transcriptional regulator [Paenibacillus selenitireducens]